MAALGAIAPLLLRPAPLFLVAAALRLALLLYGNWQDAHSALKYTDIDYLVFTDAARYLVSSSSSSPSSSSSSSSSAFDPSSPYQRDTYRYTPLLAWLLLPTTLSPQWLFFSFGKLVFALADLLAGWLILRVLLYVPPTAPLRGGQRIIASSSPSSSSQSPPPPPMTLERAGAFAALWLWNPMVATISTRGSSEGLLGVLTVALLWAVQRRRVSLAGALLGLGVHFKIYPFIYAPAIIWWMDDEHMGGGGGAPTSQHTPAKGGARKQTHSSASASSSAGGAALLLLLRFGSPARIRLALVSLATFMGLNLLMYAAYGRPFIVHTFLHHLTRIDHRHNFSPYNVLLYLTSASSPSSSPATSAASAASAAAAWHVESLAFVPQLLLSCVLIPFVLAKKDLATSMMAQTFAFVTFNKVCTSQYFLWYMIFLPLYLPRSSLLRSPKLGVTALVLWVASQGAWLQQGYQLEFLGKSTFFPGLWLSSLGFFLVNCWILGIIISDGVAQPGIETLSKTHVE
ncbi:GPI mannosyltransferase 1 [Purpureocillium takamizusanense]|uniref:GPI mannosyltransferase 1 n=1 Tax=Purpureocillium takamizusanense TaxID=2060973 RepID=A0A9Q8VFR8_9HYPO|nr:GPI mannosyltransferase 1 [Purpureocillium takamizusanense]UNI23194.1 GPI mannosyltransferase 1 [Purpureocillium takamizusanense]